MTNMDAGGAFEARRQPPADTETGRIEDPVQLCSSLQDPMAWSEVASFHLSDGGTPPRNAKGAYSPSPPPPQERTTTEQEEQEEDEEEEEEEEDVRYTVHALAAVSGSLGKQRTPLGPGRAPTPGPNAPRPGQTSLGRVRRRTGQSPMCDRTCPSFLENVQVSPRKTPSKGLPFSPSRVRRAQGLQCCFS